RRGAPARAARSDARGEDLSEPRAVPGVLVHNLLVGVPGLVLDAEESRTRILSEPHDLFLEALAHRMPFPLLTPPCYREDLTDRLAGALALDPLPNTTAGCPAPAAGTSFAPCAPAPRGNPPTPPARAGGRGP